MSTQKTTKWPDLQSFGAKLGFAITEGGRRLVLDVIDAALFKDALSPRYITAIGNLGFNQDEFRPESGLRLIASGSALNIVDLQLLFPGFRAAIHLREMTRAEVQVEHKEPAAAAPEKIEGDLELEALGAGEKFVAHVLEEDEGHNEGYSIRESVLNIDAEIKASGFEPIWAIKEEQDDEDDNSVYEVACVTFKSTMNNEVARIEIYPDGKAIFFVGEMRYRGDYYYATSDPETQHAAIKEMATLLLKPDLFAKALWQMPFYEFSQFLDRQGLTREDMGITDELYRWTVNHSKREDERLHRAVLMAAVRDGHSVPDEIKNRYPMLDLDAAEWTVRSFDREANLDILTAGDEQAQIAALQERLPSVKHESILISLHAEMNKLANEKEIPEAWADFTPNKFGYHSRDVEGLGEKYFVAQWDKDTARIVEAERGNEEAQIRRMADGRWMFEGSWATDDDITRYRETGNTFASPEEAVLHFHRYMSVIREPWQATFAEYVSFGGRQEGGYRLVGGSPSTDYSMGHREMVNQAIAEGKPVPAEVMAEYNFQPDSTVSTEETEPAATSNPTNFAEWEGEVTRHIEELLEATTSDAQGIVEAQPFIMQQAWGEGIPPAEAAARVKKAAVVVTNPPPTPATQQDVLAVIEKVKPFLSLSQLSIMGDATRGDDGQYFKDKFVELAGVIDTMPKSYETDGMGNKAGVHLHYFKGDSHWYITEKDSDEDGKGQVQAYGYAVLNGDMQFAESGYISIAELLQYGTELDLHWTPRPLAQVKDELNRSENSDDRSLAQELEADETEEVDLALINLEAAPGFAEFVMKYDKDHVEGYSPKATILHIDECAKKSGLKIQWLEAEDGTAVGTFTSPDKNANQVGGTHVFQSGKAIFMLNGERFQDYHATTDLEALENTITVLSRVILKTTTKSKDELDPSNPDDYARIMKSEALQLAYQDFLDHFMVGRMIEIRNALRELGWDDDGSRPGHHGTLLRGEEKLVEEYKQVGAGANVVGLTLNGVQDDLTRTPADWAKAIDDDATVNRLKRKLEQELSKRGFIVPTGGIDHDFASIGSGEKELRVFLFTDPYVISGKRVSDDSASSFKAESVSDFDTQIKAALSWVDKKLTDTKPLTFDKEVDISDLNNIGIATITNVGSENIYFLKDEIACFCKVGNTSKYQLGEHDFSEKTAAIAEKKPKKSKVIGKINDVGEKIGGARKDIAGRRIVLADLEQMNEAEKQELVTKDKVFPPFDYRNMRDAGVDPAVALVLKLIRDRLPTSPLKVKGWVPQHFHTVAPSWPGGRYGYGHDSEKCNAESYIKNISTVYEHLTGIATIEELQDRCRTVRELVNRSSTEIESSDFFQTAQGDRFIEAMQLRKIIGDKSYYVLCDADYYIARAQRVVKNAGGWAAVIKERTSGQQQGDKETDIIPDRPHLQSIVREGGVPRNSNVSADNLLQATGCRGIEFGNWLPQDERQSVINHAHDAFQDLATVTGLPYEAISLDGTLAMAFGARGRGGKGAALAHFEPSRKVINLTRLSGAGSLAHEWGHAIDDFLGSSLGQGGYLSEGANFSRRSEEAGEIFMAVAGLMEAIKKQEITFGECAHEANQKASKYLDWAGNWATSWGYGAFKEPETEKEYRAEIKAQIGQFKESVSDGFTQEKVKELAVLLDSFEELFRKRGGKRIKQKEKNGFTGCANASTTQASKAAQFRHQPQDAINDLGISKETDFLSGAKNLDRKRSKDYWSTGREMFARAFECWVFDTLAEQEIKSDYLVHGVEETRYAETKYRGNPYPAGEERIAINQQMDTLMAAVSVYLVNLRDQDRPAPTVTPTPSFG
jgi:hypothetical protein